MLATPCGVGANDGVMQPGHKGPQVVATGRGYAAVEPLLSSKLIQTADKLDTHLRVTGYGRCCHEKYRAHMCIPDVTTACMPLHSQYLTPVTLRHSLTLSSHTV